MNDLVFKGIDAGVNRMGDVVIDGIYSSGQCKYGRMKWLTTDYGVGQQIALYGEYSEGEVVIFRRLIKAGDVVVSAGGNIGAHLVPISQIVGGHGIVHTFEPQSALIPILRENLAVNGCGNVTVHTAALGDRECETALAKTDPAMPNNFGGLHLVDPAANILSESVRMTTLDSLELLRLDFLMLDIEGSEQAALAGGRETIARCRPLLYVEIDKEDRREPLLHFIADELKYEVMFHLPYVFNPENFARNPTNHFPDQRAIMCLAIPR